jgi:hypothetical protein
MSVVAESSERRGFLLAAAPICGLRSPLSIVVSMKSGQVAIAIDNLFIQYYLYVPTQLSAILSVCNLILRPFIPENGVYRRWTGLANREQEHAC